MKLLLYCVKAKPYLYKTEETMVEKMFGDYHTQLNKAVLSDDCLNGKIVAECDFEVEEIEYSKDYNGWLWYTTKSLWENKLQYLSCLSANDLEDYLGDKGGYAIHIKNLHIFDYPRELDEYEYTRRVKGEPILRAVLTEAPQNMQKIIAYGTDAILISIRPEWLCKILNGEKFVEVRKTVLKEMITSGNNQ